MADLKTITSYADKTAEAAILDAVSLDETWPLVEEMLTTVRLSGTEEERKAFDMIIARLESWGIPYTLHEPECFISHPLKATVRSLGPNGKEYRAKTVAMSLNTDGQEIEGELIYIPGTAGAGYKAGDIFSAGVNLQERSIAGKIVITEGMAAPGKVCFGIAATNASNTALDLLSFPVQTGKQLGRGR